MPHLREVVEPSEALFSAPETAESRRARAWLEDRLEKARHLPKDEFIHETVTITPVLAEIMLEHNRGNRPLKGRRFTYAEDMKRGEWKLHAQGISFARDGMLNNGQNRLKAVILAGVPAKMSVAFGEDRDVFPVIDIGAVRGGADSLHIVGRKNTSTLAASARLLYLVTSGSPRGNLSVSNAKILEIVDANPRLEDYTTSGAKVARKIPGSTAAGPSVAFYLIGERSKFARRLHVFADQLANGNIPTKRDPVLVLRDALKDKRFDRGSSTHSVSVCAASILAWNLWVRGKKATLSHITWRSGPFPMPE